MSEIDAKRPQPTPERGIRVHEFVTQERTASSSLQYEVLKLSHGHVFGARHLVSLEKERRSSKASETRGRKWKTAHVINDMRAKPIVLSTDAHILPARFAFFRR